MPLSPILFLSKWLLELMISFSAIQKLPWKWSEKTTDKLTFQTAVCPYSQWQTQVHERGIHPWYILFSRSPLIQKNETAGQRVGLVQMDKNTHRCILVEGFKKSSQDLKLNTWECWFLLLIGYGTKVTGMTKQCDQIWRSTYAVTTFAVTRVQALCSHLSTILEKIFGYTLNRAKK